MFKYQAKHINTFQSLERVFVTKLEAEDFAYKNLKEYPKYNVKPVFVDGIIKNENEDFDEAAELKMMGLDDEETSQGFDYTLEDKNGD